MAEGTPSCKCWKTMNIFKNLCAVLSIGFFVPSLLYATANQEEREKKPVPVGNFSLGTSQQPSPLISFGDNIIDKGQVQLLVLADALIGRKNYQTDVVPGVLYGINDVLSLFCKVPFSPGNKDKTMHSSGMEDVAAQLEYAFYNKNSSNSVDQATVLANVTFPTGSSTKTPPTGFGASSLFLGAAYNRTLVDWFFFTSYGATLTTSKHDTKFGDQFFYQSGLGRNIPSPKGWIFAWMVEFTGLYAKKNKIKGTIDPNSGGNTIFMTPSLWASSNRLIFQFGVGLPLTQHLYGDQSKKNYILSFNFGLTF